jgi:hypothetical protein
MTYSEAGLDSYPKPRLRLLVLALSATQAPARSYPPLVLQPDREGRDPREKAAEQDEQHISVMLA